MAVGPSPILYNLLFATNVGELNKTFYVKNCLKQPMFPTRRFDFFLPYGANAWKVYIRSHFSINSYFVIMLPFVSGATYVRMYRYVE